MIVVRREPVWVHASGTLGGSFQVTARDSEGREVTVEWSGPLETARKHPLTLETLREQLDRLGDTSFELAEVTSDLPADVMVPRSVINDLHRRSVAELQCLREEKTRYAIQEKDALHRLRREVLERVPGPAETGEPQLTVLVRTLEQFEAVLAWNQRPAMVYCDFEDTRRFREAVPRSRSAGVPIGLATLRILKPGEEGFLNPIVKANPDAVLVRNLGAIDYFREHLPHALQIGDFSLNVANELSADLLMRGIGLAGSELRSELGPACRPGATKPARMV